MNSLAGGALIVLALVVFNNYKAGTMGMWLRAKFFNEGPGGGGARDDAAAGGAKVVPQAYTTGGAMLAPVNGPVTSSFGPRGAKFHAGTDFGVPIGTPVAAARAGKVIAAGAAGGYGLKVDVDHGNGVVTRYAHLSKLNVRVGDTVAGGATVGLSGNTGDSTGPHLHFEVRVNGQAQNPTGYLTGAGSAPSLAGLQAVSA